MLFHPIAPNTLLRRPICCETQSGPVQSSPATLLYTTRLTCEGIQSPTQHAIAFGTVLAYLEEALQPPDLKDAFADQDTHLEHTPPLDSGVCAFCGVSVGSFAEDNVGLFVLDLGKEFGELADYGAIRMSHNGREMLCLPSASNGSDGASASGT